MVAGAALVGAVEEPKMLAWARAFDAGNRGENENHAMARESVLVRSKGENEGS